MKKWFVRLYLPAMVLVLTIGMFFTLKFGYAKEIPLVMKPSHFGAPAEIGEVIFKRFYMPIREAKLVAFGIPPRPDFHRDIFSAFLRSAKREGAGFDVVIAEEQMPAFDTKDLEGLQIVKVPTNTIGHGPVIDALTAAQGKRVLLYLPSIFSTHTLKGAPVWEIEKLLGYKILSFTTAPLALAADQEYLVDPSCLGAERDASGTSDFGCAILKAGRAYYRKKIPQQTWAAIMNQPTPDDDYLLMVSTPGQDKNNEDGNHDLRMNPPKDRGER